MDPKDNTIENFKATNYGRLLPGQISAAINAYFGNEPHLIDEPYEEGLRQTDGDEVFIASLSAQANISNNEVHTYDDPLRLPGEDFDVSSWNDEVPEEVQELVRRYNDKRVMSVARGILFMDAIKNGPPPKSPRSNGSRASNVIELSKRRRGRDSRRRTA